MSDVPSSHCEAKLHGFRRTNDGVVVSFVLHPQEVPQALALDPLGTRYILAFAQIGDDETAVPPKGDGSHGTASNTDSSPKQKRPFHTLPLSQQAYLLCTDKAFQKWVEDQMSGPERPYDPDQYEKTAAWYVRQECCDNLSRATLDNSNPAHAPEYARRFQAMVERFRREVGREAEYRG